MTWEILLHIQYTTYIMYQYEMKAELENIIMIMC